MGAEIAAPRSTAALEAAGRLVDSGRVLDAITALTAANRADRDPRVEERLVTLRHQAFRTLDRRPPRPLPPPITAEVPGVGGVPEHHPDDLTPATLRAGLAQQGCVLVRGLIPPDRAERLASGVDRALGAFDAAVEGAPPEQTTPWYVPFVPDPGEYRVGGRRRWVRASGGVWTVDSPRMLFDLVELLEDTGILELVTAHLGERPALSANKCTLRRVPTSSNTDWHQDGAFLGAEVRTVNLWLSLSHCGIDAPGLDLLPRRLDTVAQTGTDGAFFDWSVSPTVVEEEAAGTPIVRPLFAPGDALLFDHLLLHRTAISPDMQRERHAIETWMFSPSAYPDGQIPVVC